MNRKEREDVEGFNRKVWQEDSGVVGISRSASHVQSLLPIFVKTAQVLRQRRPVDKVMSPDNVTGLSKSNATGVTKQVDIEHAVLVAMERYYCYRREIQHSGDDERPAHSLRNCEPAFY